MADVPMLRAPFALSDTPTEPELVGKYFRALGDPTRVRILELLREHDELSVSDLVERLGQSRPKVSDARVSELLALGRALLADNAEHVAACRRVDTGGC